MTATNLGLNNTPVKFLGAYVKNVSNSLGQSINPSSCTVTLVDDIPKGVFFSEPVVGNYYKLEVGPNYSFAGIVTRFDRDIRNISGRQINVSMADVREIMKNIPVILAPGSQAVVTGLAASRCSLIDIFGAYNIGGGVLNFSGWNQSGMPYEKIALALSGGTFTIGTANIDIPRVVANAYDEQYRFNLDEVTNLVEDNYRVNSNLTPLSNIIEDLSIRHAFDWYVESERAADGIIDVTIRVISRYEDNIDIDLPTFLSDHDGRVISATSGVELRNELNCLALQGAPVEQMRKVTILGMANEPLDLAAESGSNAYTMTEEEMRAVMFSRDAWEVWLSFPASEGGGGGFGRYGGSLADGDVQTILPTAEKIHDLFRLNGNSPKNVERSAAYLSRIAEKRINAGKVYEKLKGHAESTYGKRFVHSPIADEIIDSCWTRDVVSGDNDPYEYFRQEDGRTRCFVEFTNSDAGGAFSLGLGDLTTLYGSATDFRYVTKYGSTFTNVLPGDVESNGSVITMNLVDGFNPQKIATSLNKSDYTWNDTTNGTSSAKRSFYVSATIDKDGVVKIDSPVFESALGEPNEILARLIAYTKNTFSSTNKLDADGRTLGFNEYIMTAFKAFFGSNIAGFISKAYQPTNVYIPTRSRVNRYGPVFSSTLDGETEGKLEIIQDDGFCPWEFGGVSLMLAAMQMKVDNATSYQREAFSATVVVEGFPEYGLGESIGKNSNISNISISFGVDGGVRTTYNFQTFTRKFGELSNEDWARLAYFASNGGGRVLPQRQSSFTYNHNVRVNKNTGGSGRSGASLGGVSFG
jgi:hypothetical protein